MNTTETETDTRYAELLTLAGQIKAAAEECRTDGRTAIQGSDKVWLHDVIETLVAAEMATEDDVLDGLAECNRLGLIHAARLDLTAASRDYKGKAKVAARHCHGTLNVIRA